jgi:hypothetical protein
MYDLNVMTFQDVEISSIRRGILSRSSPASEAAATFPVFKHSGVLQAFCKVIPDSHDDVLIRNSLRNKDPTENCRQKMDFPPFSPFFCPHSASGIRICGSLKKASVQTSA